MASQAQWYELRTSSMIASAGPIALFDDSALRSRRDGPSLAGAMNPERDYRPALRSAGLTRQALERRTTCLSEHGVEASPRDALPCRTVAWEGMRAEVAEIAGRERFELRFRAPFHLLVVYEQGSRRDGETTVSGLPRSTLRDVGRKLTFVPAGHEYREWHEPRTPLRLMFFYFDPARLQLFSDAAGLDAPEAAKLYFEDATLLDTALKLKRSLEAPAMESEAYLEALGVVLVHELIRFTRGAPRPTLRHQGGLAPWQQRAVTAYIDEHLDESIPLATLAGLARLSPYYFCRVFKQSFGMPPHRYHTNRRIERAKSLLKQRSLSVTDIGYSVGYSETSSFTAAFRKATGTTPSAYRRSLD